MKKKLLCILAHTIKWTVIIMLCALIGIVIGLVVIGLCVTAYAIGFWASAIAMLKFIGVVVLIVAGFALVLWAVEYSEIC